MLYIPILNPITFAPAQERNPITGDIFGGRAQIFPSGERVQLQFYTDEDYYPMLFFDYDDGKSELATIDLEYATQATSALDGVTYHYLCLIVTLPRERAFRLRVRLGAAEAVSGCLCTVNDTSSLCRLAFGSDALMEFDTLMFDRPYTFTPTVYIPGGFFTSGFTPVIDGEEFLDANRVSRYLSAWPSVTRDFIMGGAQGLDNRLAAMLNAAFCLPSIEIDGKRYVRYAGASMKALGDKQIPCRAWSITLQNADGDYSVAFDTSEVSGELVDSKDRYIVDALDRYIQTKN